MSFWAVRAQAIINDKNAPKIEIINSITDTDEGSEVTSIIITIDNKVNIATMNWASALNQMEREDSFHRSD